MKNGAAQKVPAKANANVFRRRRMRVSPADPPTMPCPTKSPRAAMTPLVRLLVRKGLRASSRSYACHARPRGPEGVEGGEGGEGGAEEEAAVSGSIVSIVVWASREPRREWNEAGPVLREVMMCVPVE